MEYIVLYTLIHKLFCCSFQTNFGVIFVTIICVLSQFLASRRDTTDDVEQHFSIFPYLPLPSDNPKLH